MRRGRCLWLTLITAVPASSQGDPTCWLGEINYQTCCLPPPTGNPNCWDGTYSYQRCCREVGEAVDINAVEDISQLGGCELNIFQEFKARSGAPLGPSPAFLLLSCANSFFSRSLAAGYFRQEHGIAMAPQTWSSSRSLDTLPGASTPCTGAKCARPMSAFGGFDIV